MKSSADLSLEPELYTAEGLPIYVLGRIPSYLTAYPDKVLTFNIEIPNRSSLSPQESDQLEIKMVVRNKPLGEICLENDVFSYEPDEWDRRPFSVEFSAQVREITIDQTVLITPIPKIKPEYSSVSKDQDLPDPASSLYLKIFEQKHKDGWHKIISGVHVVFNKNDPYNLLKQFHHDRPDEKESVKQESEVKLANLTICADTFVIYGEFWLPETNVVIFARKLELIEQDNVPGRIVTTPIPYAHPKAADGYLTKKDGEKIVVDGENGVDGRKAGNIVIHGDQFGLNNDFRSRFILTGGRGQDAGEGQDGEPGESVRYMPKWRFYIVHRGDSILYEFNPPATYIDLVCYEAVCGGAKVRGKSGGHLQKDRVPTDGKLAIKPGKPGTGGNGGDFRAYFPKSREDLQKETEKEPVINTQGGTSGEKAKDCKGGSKGLPQHSAWWKITCRQVVEVWKFLTFSRRKLYKVHRCSQDIIKGTERKTKDGKGAIAPGPDKERGEKGSKTIHGAPEFANMWLHPSSIQALLSYVRDAYLQAPEKMWQLTPLLETYHAALESQLEEALKTQELSSKSESTSKWRNAINDSGVEFDGMLFFKAQTELSTLLHRIESHLDYFGNPLGWTPLFNLNVCLQMYKEEVNHALKTWLLANWIERKSKEKEDLAKRASQSIDSLNEDTARALSQIEKSKTSMERLKTEIQGLETQINKFTENLATLRTRLRNEAQRAGAGMPAWIDFGVKTLSALTQVIPYGQPVIGTLGSIGEIITDTVIDEDKEALDVAGPLGKLIGDTIKAEFGKQADEMITVARYAKKPETADALKEAIEKRDKGKRISSALSTFTDGIKGLSVSKKEVNARLQKLEAESPQFEKMTKELKSLNETKVELFQKLNETIQTLSTAYSRITSNIMTVKSMQRQRQKALEVLDHEALLYVREMDQRARLMLVKHLYYLAKSYEYATLEPIEFNYQLPAIFDKINQLLEDNKFDPSALTPLFESELKALENKLLDTWKTPNIWTHELVISNETPNILSHLNETGEAIINLKDFGLIDHQEEKITIEDIIIEEIEFEDDKKGVSDSEERDPERVTTSLEGVEYSESHVVIIEVEPLGQGIMRSNNTLYRVRHPTSASSAMELDSEQIWGATYSFYTDKITLTRPDTASLELLDSLMHNTSKEIKEKIAKPAAWTDVRIGVKRKAQGLPPLKKLRMVLKLNSTRALRNFCVLDVRMAGNYTPLIKCSPPDASNNRTDGYGGIYRIYSRNTRDIKLEAPTKYGKQAFDFWEVIDNTNVMVPRIVRESTLLIPTLKYNMQVTCYYKEDDEQIQAST
ncbi:MAG: hypothetical protein ACFFBD_11205 [Candidatus Hodarchaeota archaeon]